MQEIAARSRLVLNAGQHGILCLGLFAGLPQVCLPQHLEQDFHARRAAAEGVATVLSAQDRSPAQIIQAVSEAWSEAPRQARARALAQDLRAAAPRSPAADAAAALAPLRQRLLAGA